MYQPWPDRHALESDPTAEPRPCKVLQAFHNPPNIIWEIRIDAGILGQTDVVNTTAGHPFFVKSKGRAAMWRQAQDIQVGDKLRTPDGKWVTVDNVLCTKHKQEVFNLEVEDAHTYFVALPNSGKAVWVHNNSMDAPYYPPAPQAANPAPTGGAPFITSGGGSQGGSGTFHLGFPVLAGKTEKTLPTDDSILGDRLVGGPYSGDRLLDDPLLNSPLSGDQFSSGDRWSNGPSNDQFQFGDSPLFPTEYVPLAPGKIDTSLNDLIPIEQQEAVTAPTILGMLGRFLGILGDVAPPIAAGSVVFHSSSLGYDMVPARHGPVATDQGSAVPAEPTTVVPAAAPDGQVQLNLPFDEPPGVGGGVTAEGIQEIERHLSRSELNSLEDGPNAAMLARLRAGETTLQDMTFYEHELYELGLMDQGTGAREAHLKALEWQGIPYAPGYESQIYHPSVIQQFPKEFPPAASR